MDRVSVIRGAVPKWAAYNGYDNGYGSGNGNGYGYGDGYGYGSGNGYGYGDGDGDGDGYGYGYGYGDGDGDGYGYGYGYGDYWLATIPYYVSHWTDAQRARLAELQATSATIAFWRSNAQGEPCNGGRGTPVSVGTRQTVKGPLSLCACGTLHATCNPPQWKGERLWIVALIGDVVSDGEKYGALEREILGEVRQTGTPVGG